MPRVKKSSCCAMPRRASGSTPGTCLGSRRRSWIWLEIRRLMEAFTERLLEWQMAYWDMALDEVGEYVDLVQLNEDLGTQRGPMMAPATFRRIYKPRMRRLVEHIHKKTKARIYLHSCGSIYRFIPDIIEIGIEVLNPVQVNAVEMDSARLKRDFGKDLTFWGGGCDPVVLQNGSPKDVAEEVKRRIHDLAPGGGFVFGSVHNIQAKVPVENIVALFDAAQRIWRVPDPGLVFRYRTVLSFGSSSARLGLGTRPRLINEYPYSDELIDVENRHDSNLYLYRIAGDRAGTLAEFQNNLKRLGADVSWVKPSNIHLTLKFLGEVPEQKLARYLQ